MQITEAVARALARRNNADRFWQTDAQYLDYAQAALVEMAEYFERAWDRFGDATTLPGYTGCSDGCLHCLMKWLREQTSRESTDVG